MKKMYWQAHYLPRTLLLVVCLLALVGMFVVEHYKKFVPLDYYAEKVEAARLAKKAMSSVKSLRSHLGIPINRQNDPSGTGLVGDRLTNITTDQGDLAAKRTSVNPNIAAIFVEWLKEADLQKGDYVAVGATGSFPALDICILSAIKTLKIHPLLIYSAGASQYGANIYRFTWLDMYEHLKKEKIFDYPLVAASLGGSRDTAEGMTASGKAALESTIKRYNINYLQPKGTIDAIDQRMTLYEKAADGHAIAAYINVGGGMASIGLKQVANSKIKNAETLKQHSLPTGVIVSFPISLANTDSVAVRYLKKGVPVVNIRNVYQTFRQKYDLPRVPSAYPIIGWGSIFFHEEYSDTVTAIVLILIILVLVVVATISRKYFIRYIQH